MDDLAAGRGPVLRAGYEVNKFRRFAVPAKFLVVGVANTIVGLLTIYMCKWALSFGDVTANATGYGVGLMLGFALNRNWTFRHRGAMWPALARFLMAFAVAYLVNLATVMSLVKAFAVNAYLAHACGIAPYTVVLYLASRHFAFRNAGAQARGVRA